MRPTFIYSALKTRSPSSCVFVFRIEALELLLVISCFLSWRKHHRMPLLSYISFYHYGLPVTSCFESSASSLPWWVGAGLCAGCLMGCILFKLLMAPPVWFLWLKPCYDCVVADPDFLWGHILKMLNANMPEEFYVWMSNLKQILTPLLERAMDLLQAVQ